MPPPPSLEDLAVYFFSLPHPRFTHDGVENHYHFSISPAAYADPDDDIVQVVKVAHNFTHIGGPMQLRVLPLKKKVDTVLRFLFISFLTGLPTKLNDEIQLAIRELGGFAGFSKNISSTIISNGGSGGYGDGTSRLIRLTLAEDRKVAPFSWSTDDAELAQAMSMRLHEFAGLIYRIHPLLNVRLADERDNRAAMITYIAFQHSLIRGIKKHTTDVLRDTSATFSRHEFDSVPPTPVTLAKRTLVTSVIEEEDENDSDVVEQPNKEVANAQAKLFNPDPDGEFPDPSTYYNTKAYRVKGACDLASSVNLILPEGKGSQNEAVSIIMPLRRLIITNRDNPHNLTLLLGPRFHSSALAQSLYASIRVKTALVPPIGSTLYNFFYFLDRGCPYRRPGPLSLAEQKTCSKVYSLLRFMKHKMGTLGRKVDEEEINEIMEVWAQEDKGEVEMELWKMAVGCLEQGLQPNLQC
ncbi:hypothetical protein PISL3812_00085 [Talaromyces islandicus]|uniref:Uncharacterized protein n=1 Tax=Talaromyces islandicus TaxID=28573 RepID=A0A0U1LK72_TALIS|nr:hypothetical protein PISL3812_00085 [Talaromyces islandicus]